MERFWKMMLNIDRRIIYLLMLLAVIIPLVTHLNLPTKPTPEVEAIFNTIEELTGTGKAVLVSMDYDPSTQPELQPMSKAVIRHCILRDIPVIGITLIPAGIGLGLQAMVDVAQEYDAENYKDYVYLGFQTPPFVVMLGIGENIHRVFPEDYTKRKIDEIEMMRSIRNYNDIGLVVAISGSSMPLSWIQAAHTRYGSKVATGVTAVSAADFYPYLQTGQFVGMMGGIKGAAEYEVLLDRLEDELGTMAQREKRYSPEELAHWRDDRRYARRAMNPQSIAHLTIIAFVLIGNIGYIVVERKQKKL
jgi:hypothetical protein